MTYASFPEQDERLGQRTHKRVSRATAPAPASVTDDRRIGTTLPLKGETELASPRNLVEQASGVSGAVDVSQAPINSKAGVASGSVCIGASSMSGVGHTAAPVPQRSSSTESYILNPNRKRLSAFSDYNFADFNPAAFAGLFLITLSAVTVVFGAAVFFGWLASVVFQ